MNFRNSLFISLIGGVLLGLSWPTYGLYFLSFIGIIPFIYVSQKYVSKKRFLTFFAGFLLWNIISTYWLIYATTFGFLFAVLVNSLMMSTVFYLYSIISKNNGNKLGYIFLVSIWICFEKFHLYWDFSWPWLNLGNVFSENVKIIQWYEYTGTFGGTLWVLIINILIFISYESYKQKRHFKKPIFFTLMLLILPTLVSLIKYYNFNENGKKVNITIIQPNIDPYDEKYKIRNIDNISYLKSLITKNNISNSKIILPETYFSEGIQLNSYNYNQFTENLNSIIKKNNNHLITGFEPYEIIYDKDNISAFSNKINNNRWINIFNSALFLNGNNSSFYHKSKLVVGVEKMPYKNIIEPLLGDILLDFGGLSMTRGQQQNRESFYTDKDSYISPIICYESVYGEYVTKYFNKGYGILAIITNDAWWGNSQGHKQHMSYARLRAIENRKNIVRSANTGISGLINSRGDIEIKSNYDEEIVLNYQAYENDKVTFYIMYGDYIFRISLMLSLIIFSYFISSKIRGKN